MFYERPGIVKVSYTIDGTGMEPITGVYKTRAIAPSVVQIIFWNQADSISWKVFVQGGVARRDGTVGEAHQEHEFSDFWNEHDMPAPDSIMAVVERFQGRAAAAIAAGIE